MYELAIFSAIVAICGLFCAFCYILTKDDKELHGRGKEELD